MSLHVCRAPALDRTLKVPDDRPTRYCFGCRKRLPHSWEFGFYDEPTYWEPPHYLRCSGCGQDRALFPGLEFDGPRPIPQKVLKNLSAAIDEGDQS